MAKVDFYVIPQASENEAHFFACRLIEKIYNQGLKVYIHTDSKSAAQALDDLLWSFRPESFVPHTIINSEDEEDIPVIIGYGKEHTGPDQVLINLSTEVPAFHHKFQRITEIVCNNEESKKVRREHWSYYKQHGFELSRHQI